MKLKGISDNGLRRIASLQRHGQSGTDRQGSMKEALFAFLAQEGGAEERGPLAKAEEIVPNLTAFFNWDDWPCAKTDILIEKLAPFFNEDSIEIDPDEVFDLVVEALEETDGAEFIAGVEPVHGSFDDEDDEKAHYPLGDSGYAFHVMGDDYYLTTLD